MRSKCRGPACGRDILMAMDEQQKWIPLDDRVPIYRIVRTQENGRPMDRAVRIPLGEAGVLHHVTCKDRDRFSRAAAPLTAGAQERQIKDPAQGQAYWEREIRDPSSGDVRLERAPDPHGPWTVVPGDKIKEDALRFVQQIAALDPAKLQPMDSEAHNLIRLARVWLRGPEGASNG